MVVDLFNRINRKADQTRTETYQLSKDLIAIKSITKGVSNQQETQATQMEDGFIKVCKKCVYF